MTLDDLHPPPILSRYFRAEVLRQARVQYARPAC